MKELLNSKKTFNNRRIDGDGFREIVLIGNENPMGCPFKCIACGVSSEAKIVSADKNKKIISYEISVLKNKIQNNIRDYKRKNFHLLVYNFGNITNPEELSRENLIFLLHEVDKLTYLPKYISLNSRGKFITKELLLFLKDQKFKFKINFIIGIESMTEKGSLLYGKKNIKEEFRSIFDIISSFNIENKTCFGLDTSFVFLPEFYVENRNDAFVIKNGFENDLMSFINLYVGKNVPIKISIHPYYKTSYLHFESTYDYLEIITDVVCKIKNILSNINKGSHGVLRNTIFIGIKDKGYESAEWVTVLNKWIPIIERINTSV